MDFAYSEEQSALRELARKILEEQATPERVREIEESEERLDRALWRELAKANLLGAALPERFGGSGYGFFELDPVSRQALLASLPEIPSALIRGSAWVTLWDEVLERHVAPIDFMELMLRALPAESDELNVQRMLSYLRSTYWRLLAADTRARLAPRMEATVRDGLARARTTSLKAVYFAALRNIALTTETSMRCSALNQKISST